MSRLLFLLIWCGAGFLLMLSGCRAYLGAKELEASVTIQQEEPDAPTVVEVHYDEDSNRPGPDIENSP